MDGNSVDNRDEGRVEQSVIDEVDDSHEKNEDGEPDVDKKGEENVADADDKWEDVLGTGRLRMLRLSPPTDPSAPRPVQGERITVDYETEFEQKVVSSEKNVVFQLNESEVIPAIDLVAALMRQGEKCRVIADPDFAYGPKGLVSDRDEVFVPPNAAIDITLELTKVDPYVEPKELDLKARMEVGMRKKERGNWWYAREEFTRAIQCYRKATDYFDDRNKFDLDAPIDRHALPQELQDLIAQRIRVFNNLAQCHVKVEAFEAALMALAQVLKIDPNNEKALYRKARCLESRLSLDEALGILRRLNRLYPNNKQAKADLFRLNEKQKRNLRREGEISRRMLGLDKNDENKTKRKATTTMLMVGGVVAAAIAATAAAVFYRMRSVIDVV